MFGAVFGTTAVTVPSFITVATQVAMNLPPPNQLAILAKVGGLADALQGPSEQVSVSDETFRLARDLLREIVAMPEAGPHIGILNRFRDAWGIDAPRVEPKPSDVDPTRVRDGSGLPTPAEFTDHARARVEQELTKLGFAPVRCQDCNVQMVYPDRHGSGSGPQILFKRAVLSPTTWREVQCPKCGKKDRIPATL